MQTIYAQSGSSIGAAWPTCSVSILEGKFGDYRIYLMVTPPFNLLGFYISQRIRFARVPCLVTYFNARIIKFEKTLQTLIADTIKCRH